jgi:amino acid transporter
MVETMALAFPILAEPVPRGILIIALFTFLAVVNIMGVKSGVRLFIFNTMAKLVPLVLLLAVGLFAINFENLAITEWPSISSIGAGAIVLFFAFAGAESGLSASGEIKNPSKTVPMGLLVGLTGILALYVGLQTVAQGVLGPELANNVEAPLAAVATEVFGEWGAKMLLVGGVISIYSTVSGDMLSAPRVVFASARDNNLPKFLATVHPKYKTPYVSVIFFAAVVCTFALSGTFKPLAVLASGSILVIDGGVSLAVLRLRHRDGEPSAGQFKLPFGSAVPVLSCLVVGWLLWQLTAGEAIGLAAMVGISALVYAIRIVGIRVLGGKES